MSRPWMPLYVADYLADTGHLRTVEHGAYMLLIMHYWQNGGLPTEETKLARIARLSGKEWTGVRETLSALFEPDWTHGRIEQELEKAEDVTAKRREAGMAGAKARHGKRKLLPKQTNGLHSHSHTSSDKSEDEFLVWFAAYPRRTAKGRARKAYAAARKKTDAETLLSAAKAYAASQPDPQYIPHPATWLNDERWLDEPAKPATNGHAAGQSMDAWPQRVAGYRADLDAGKPRPFWNMFWGPRPDQPGCGAPPEILERYGFRNQLAAE